MSERIKTPRGTSDVLGDEARARAELERIAKDVLERFDDDTRVHPGHMGLTTLGRERATNPFLQALAGS